MRSMMGSVASIITDMMAPEIKPNVQIVFFMVRWVEDGDILQRRADFRVTLSGDFRKTVTKSPVQAIKPASFAIWTAWVRRRAFSLSNNRLECVFTVFSLTNSWAAISRLLNPAAMRVRI